MAITRRSGAYRLADRAYLATCAASDLLWSGVEHVAWRAQRALAAFVANHRRKRHRVFSVTRRWRH